ncbi:MAG: hypothetical protein GY756_13480 [bacterium]|nr:hypothetical protein [bacterium]
MSNKKNFIELLSKFDENEKISFYMIFLHNLTIAIRSIWSNQDLTDKDKILQIKWVNEVIHNIISLISHIRSRTNSYTDEKVWEGIKHWASQNNNAASEIASSLKMTYETFANK